MYETAGHEFLVVQHDGSMLRQQCRNVRVGQHAAGITHSSVSFTAIDKKLFAAHLHSPLSLLHSLPSAVSQK